MKRLNCVKLWSFVYGFTHPFGEGVETCTEFVSRKCKANQKDK